MSFLLSPGISAFIVKHFFDSLDQKDVKIDDNLDRLPANNVEVKTTFKLEKPPVAAAPVSEQELVEKANEVLKDGENNV